MRLACRLCKWKEEPLSCWRILFCYIERISLEQLEIDGQKYEPTRQMQGKFLTTFDVFWNSEQQKIPQNQGLDGIYITYEVLKMPAVGLEPTRSCLQQILSLPRLPFRHAGGWTIDIIAHYKNKVKMKLWKVYKFLRQNIDIHTWKC